MIAETMVLYKPKLTSIKLCMNSKFYNSKLYNLVISNIKYISKFYNNFQYVFQKQGYIKTNFTPKSPIALAVEYLLYL